MDFEKSTLEAVIQARNQAVKVNAAGPEGIKQISQAENALSSALQRLMVVVEQYPQLKATGNVGQLQEELTSTENKVAFARQLYNDTATQYNTKQQQFPTNLVAGVARAQPADLWEIERSEEHTSELQSPYDLVCRLLLEKKKKNKQAESTPHPN